MQNQQLPPENKDNRPTISPMRFMGLGFEFVGILLFPAFVGYALKRTLYLDTNQGSWFIIAGIFIGFAYGIYYLYRIALEVNRSKIDNTPPFKFMAKPAATIEERAKRVTTDLDELGERIDGIIAKRKGDARTAPSDAAPGATHESGADS